MRTKPCGVMTPVVALLCLALGSVAWAQTWNVYFGVGAKPYHQVLACEARDLYVDFMLHHAWCVSSIRYRGEIVGQPSGATGSVFQWNGKALGTGHGGEVVRSVMLIVDGKAVPLVEDGQAKFNAKADRWSGREVKLLKKSVIGPFDHEAEFHLPASSDHYTVEHRYKVNAEWPKGKFTGYTYVFMQMMPTDFTEWLLQNGEGALKQGNLTGKAGYVLSDEPFRALACHAPAKQLGIAFVYPREYGLLNHLLDRGSKDRKFRAALAKREGYAVGDAFAYRMKVVPFTASHAAWMASAKAIFNDPLKP